MFNRSDVPLVLTADVNAPFLLGYLLSVVPIASESPPVVSVFVTPSSGVSSDLYTANISVSGKPWPEISIQWSMDGMDLPGGTTTGITPEETSDPVGGLRVRVTATNEYGSMTATSALVDVVQPTSSGPEGPSNRQVYSEALLRVYTEDGLSRVFEE